MLFTSESVTEGHPDKICDQISDAILDEMIKKDPKTRAAIETFITNGICFIAGEVTTNCYVDVAKVARQVIKDIGYVDARFGFHWETSGVMVSIKAQSDDIALGVDSYKADKSGKILKEDLKGLGAGDQGIMFGYASNENKAMMPLPIYLSHKLAQRLAEVRKNNTLAYLRPDGKTQVTIEYLENEPVKIDTILIAAQHEPNISIDRIKKDIKKNVVEHVIKEFDKEQKQLFSTAYNVDTKKYRLLINTTGKFVIGGPQADTGLTGRKNIVDTYGGFIPHGGGAFCGKDPTKVDRSAQYMARYVAKHIVASGLADKVLIQIAYAIGVPEPLGIWVNTFGTGKEDDLTIIKKITKVFDLRPGAIIKDLNLRQAIYKNTASYGAFGRDDLNLPWEKIDKKKIEQLRKP